ncbi:MAG: hypothetical protein GX134_10630 [candidate division WS1 bacterium]|jgi:hypothetical protein|nr:hypothetical protein [candidate division WS1 bacterium]
MADESRERESQLRETIQAFYDTKIGVTVISACNYILYGSVGVLVLCLLYLALAVLSGDLGDKGITAAGAAKYQWIGLLFMYSVICGSLAYLVRSLEDDGLILIAGIGGAVVYFGLPILMELGIHHFSSATPGPNLAVDLLRKTFIFVGVFLWGLGALRAAIFVVDRMLTDTSDKSLPDSNRELISRAADRPLKANVYTRPGPLARCWELPHCIDFIREVCKPWEVKRSCWRLQTGCMCDARYLYQALRKDRTEGVRADEADWLQEEAKSMGGGEFERKLFCRDCRIYQEHQRRKFRFLSPLAIPITALLVYALHPLFLTAYNLVIERTAGLVKTMWLAEGGADAAQEFVTDMSGQGVVYAILALFALFMLSAVMRFIEWLTLEAML